MKAYRRSEDIAWPQH